MIFNKKHVGLKCSTEQPSKQVPLKASISASFLKATLSGFSPGSINRSFSCFVKVLTFCSRAQCGMSKVQKSCRTVIWRVCTRHPIKIMGFDTERLTKTTGGHNSPDSSLTSWRVTIAKTELLNFSTMTFPLCWARRDPKIFLTFDRNSCTSKQKKIKKGINVWYKHYYFFL